MFAPVLAARPRTPVAATARVAAGQAYAWAGSRVDVESLTRLRADWYPRVQHYLKTVGIFAAAARDTAQTIADLRWSPDDETFGESPTRTGDPRWARLAESLGTLDWFRAAHQIYGPGVVHIVCWPDPDTMLRFEVFSMSELTPPLSGHADAAPIVVRHESDMPRPLWEPGTPPAERPRIVTAFRPDGEYGRAVWTPAQALLDDFEALLLMSVAAKAYDLNRITGAGILYLPNSLAQLDNIPEGQAKTVMNAPNIRAIMDGFMKPMSNPYAPERVVPAIITGPDDMGDKIKQILWERQEDADAFTKNRDARWRSIAVALDQPAGRVLNSEDQSKFFNSQAIDFYSMRATVGIAKIISSALLAEVFRPIMDQQWGDESARKRTLTPTYDHLQPEPDRTDEALRMLDAGMITLAHAQDLAKIPADGRIEVGSVEWRKLLEWRRKLQGVFGGDTGMVDAGADPEGVAVPPSTGPAAPGTAPDGAGAPDTLDAYDPLAGFDAALAAAARPVDPLVGLAAELDMLRAQSGAKTAAAQDHTGGVMVALPVPLDIADTIAVPGGESVDDLHVTVVYLGKTADLDRVAIEAVLATVTGAPLSGTIGGIGRFPTSHKEGLQAVWVPVDVPGLSEFHTSVVDALAAAGIGQGSVHGYTPHVTLDYVTPDQPSPGPVPAVPVAWDTFTLVWDGDRVEFPLTAPVAVTAAAADPGLAEVAAGLNTIDRDLMARIAGACELAMRAAMRRTGARLVNRAPATVKRATADLAGSPWLIPERLGPVVCAAMLAAAGNDDPLLDAFDDLGDQAEGWMAAAFLASLGRAGVAPDSAAGVAAIERATVARAAAVDMLKTQMTDLARARIFQPGTGEVRGEAVSGLVPAGIPGRSVAVAGGAPVVTVEGVTRIAAAEGAPPAGLATGPIVLETLAALTVDPFDVEYTWRTGQPANPFKPHHDLAGVTVRALTDPRLAASADTSWLSVGHLHPLDHAGCQCWWDIAFVPKAGV